LASAVSLRHVGLILAYEASRLARGTLLADTEVVYDPSDYHDRLLLGLQGMLSEAELHLLQLRLAVAGMERAGGWITLDDLARCEAKWRAGARDLSGSRDRVDAAPSSGGPHIIQILNLLEHDDVRGLGFGTVEGVHRYLEALKIAFTDRARYLADPDAVDVPVEALAREVAAAYHPLVRRTEPTPVGSRARKVDRGACWAIGSVRGSVRASAAPIETPIVSTTGCRATPVTRSVGCSG
jgi:hypothetical protein